MLVYGAPGIVYMHDLNGSFVVAKLVHNILINIIDIHYRGELRFQVVEVSPISIFNSCWYRENSYSDFVPRKYMQNVGHFVQVIYGVCMTITL